MSVSDSDKKQTQQVWWVNQGKTYSEESTGGFLWAPVKDKRGATPYHWATMSEVGVGDIVLHYSQGQVVAVSEVREGPRPAANPPEIAREYPDRDGTLVRAEYVELGPRIPLQVVKETNLVTAIDGGPLQADGRVKMGYLFRFSVDALREVVSSFATTWPKFVLDAVSQKASAQLVTSIDQVADNVRRFHEEIRSLGQVGTFPVQAQQYFAYDPISGWFAPAEYAGCLHMTLDKYWSCQERDAEGFDGYGIRMALKKVCGAPVDSTAVSRRFKDWLTDWGLEALEDVEVLSAGGVIDPPLLEQFCAEIRSIRVDTSSNQVKPYKPLLLLAAVDAIAAGHPLTFGPPLLDYYKRYANAIGANAANPNYPYYHLTSDGFWEVLNSDGSTFASSGTPNKGELTGTIAGFKGGRERCIIDLRLRSVVVKAIQSHFEPSEWRALKAVMPAQLREDGPSYATDPIGDDAMDLQAVVGDFGQALQTSHIFFGDRHFEVVRSFVVSLATKRFVILTGLSGSGKTQIALKFGEWLGRQRFRIVSVRPDWTGPESLFGYEDALQSAQASAPIWQVPEALEFMLLAANDPTSPYLLILDEMNLAHVERYFADALSGMESDKPILPNLVRDGDGKWRARGSGQDKLVFPKNLFVVGTVNVDETTYMFSPKVLDRANTIEFRVDTSELSAHIRRPIQCRAAEQPMIAGFLRAAADGDWHLENPHPDSEILVGYLRSLHRILAEFGLEFGHRTFYEAIRFASLLASSGDSQVQHALDLQVIQKILPRLHGSRRQLEPVLSAVGKFCFHQPMDDDQEIDQFDPLAYRVGDAWLPISYRKIRAMTRNLRVNQFASFAE